MAVSAHRGQLVKASEQLVQRHDQLLRRALRRQAGEALDVREQYAAGGAKVKEARGRTEERDGEDKETEKESNQFGGQ